MMMIVIAIGFGTSRFRCT